jgi:hypothetical protein
MKGWKTQFGSGLEKVYNSAIKRGAFGRAERKFKKWWNQVIFKKNVFFLITIDFLKKFLNFKG